MSKRILIAIHPGFINTPAVDRARSLASKIDVDILLYSAVYDELIPSLNIASDDIEKMRQSILDSENDKLTKIKNELDDVAKSVEIQSQWHHPIVDGIEIAAKKFNADLIIVSSTRHATLTRLMLTNTDWEILRHVTTPVMFSHHNPKKPYKKVMIAVDPTHEHDKPAELDHRMISIGKWISDSYAGEIELAHAYPSVRTEVAVDYIPSAEEFERWKRDHENAMWKLATENNIDKSNIHFLDEHPRIAIPDLAKKIGADLVIMGVVSRSFFKRFMIGWTSEYVLDHLKCDVLTVHAHSKPRT